MIRHLSTFALILATPALLGAAVVNCNNGPTSAIGNGPDDRNVSTLTQCDATFITQASNVGGQDWIMRSLTNAGFTLANGWDFAYAANGAAGTGSALYTVNQYSAWVVSEPDVASPGGGCPGAAPGCFAGRADLQDVDAGGAVFVFSYNPLIDDFAPSTNIHFIQAYRQSLNGGAFTLNLDGNTATNPFYDARGAAGTNGAESWFLDTPADCENPNSALCNVEPGVEGYHTDVQFNVMMAVDNGREGANDPNPGKESVTLYAGYGWGYQYSNTDLPEPSFTALTGLALAAAAFIRRRRQA